MNKSIKNIATYIFFLLLCPFVVQAQETYIKDLRSSHVVDSLSNQEIETFERDIRSTVFIPKGQWAVGLSVNYSQSTQNDYQFLIIEDIKGDTYSFKVTPMVCYFVKDDMGVGGKFGYSRNLTKLESANIVLDSETNYNVNDLYSLSHNYYGMAIMRN